MGTEKGSVVALDPGIEGCGVAVFSEGVLFAAAYVRNDTAKSAPLVLRQVNMAAAAMRWLFSLQGPHTNYVVVEMPRVYPRSKGDPNDLIAIAGVAAAFARSFVGGAGPHMYYPAEWKGQVPKDIMGRRIKAKLSAEELGRIESIGAKDHNTIDAIGIGLKFLGRL